MEAREQLKFTQYALDRYIQYAERFIGEKFEAYENLNSDILVLWTELKARESVKLSYRLSQAKQLLSELNSFKFYKKLTGYED